MPYWCDGPERGNCGKSHATAQEAVDHIREDHLVTGWTDRQVGSDDGVEWMIKDIRDPDTQEILQLVAAKSLTTAAQDKLADVAAAAIATNAEAAEEVPPK